MECECDLERVGDTAAGKLCDLHAALIAQAVGASDRTGDVALIRLLRRQAKRIKAASLFEDTARALALAADEIERLNARITRMIEQK